MESIEKQILHRLEGKRPGWIFTPKDLEDLGSSTSIEHILESLVKTGKIRHFTRGLYDFPKVENGFEILESVTS
ncbi:MAG: type IV toxin-antitoxin system AbiEi family antitoxin domain-containing protein [Alphaproteobacteria bacterium]|jgi:hypothetical protein|nr:type IV toxin-antitoxin system AbiEi family antitoxin domain-containing protein [Alphaproteobacteria bacterium]MBT5390402.1 type IV toxin-antitoxin system AbiEi family antitoxin domain-containing protein [Alphaproteobacteria bacterium]